MSGHSNWHSISTRRARRREAGKLSRSHSPDRDCGPVGGGDPSECDVADMVQKGADNSVRSHNQSGHQARDRGKKRASSTSSVSYEATRKLCRGDVKALSDNRQSDAAEIKNICSRNGVSFAEAGAVRGSSSAKCRARRTRRPRRRAPVAASRRRGEDVQDLGGLGQVTTPTTELHAGARIEDAGSR